MGSTTNNTNKNIVEDVKTIDDFNSKPKPRSRIPPFNNALSEDEIVMKKFVDNIQYKVDNGLFRSLTPKEKDVIKDIVFYPGFFVGCFVGVGSFYLMRRMPVYIMDRMQQHRHEYLKQNVKQITTEDNIKPKPFQETPVVNVVGK